MEDPKKRLDGRALSGDDTTHRSKTARLTVRGGYQYVTLPKEFQFEGDRVRLRRVSGGVLIEPIGAPRKILDVKKWLAEMSRHKVSPDCFAGDWRDQPRFPARQKKRK